MTVVLQHRVHVGTPLYVGEEDLAVGCCRHNHSVVGLGQELGTEDIGSMPWCNGCLDLESGKIAGDFILAHILSLCLFCVTRLKHVLYGASIINNVLAQTWCFLLSGYMGSWWPVCHHLTQIRCILLCRSSISYWPVMKNNNSLKNTGWYHAIVTLHLHC